MRSRATRLVTASVLTLALTAAVELALRLSAPEASGFHVWPAWSSRRMLPRADIFPGVSGPADFRVGSHGLRADELEPDHDPLILVLGGSTTECQVLDQGETWPALLQAALSTDGRRAWVGNAGRSGHSTREHLVQAPRLLDALPHTDLLLVLAGVNDLGLLLRQGARFDADFPDGPEQEAQVIAWAFATTPAGFRQQRPLWKRSELYAQLRGLKDWSWDRLGWWAGEPGSGEAVARWRDNRRHATELLPELPDLEAALAGYARRLERIVRAAIERDVRVVLMTQPSLWRADLAPAELESLWWGGVGEFQAPEARVSYYTVEALADAMARFNEETLRVAEATGVVGLDLAAAIPRTSEMFFDDMHFTEQGARRVAEVVAARVVQSDLLGCSR